MASINGDGINVLFDAITSEKRSRGGKVTSSPIEGNKTINDHFVKNPDSLAIAGVCTRRASNKLANLSRLFNNGVLCRYYGINNVGNVIITKLDTTHGGQLGNGFQFTMTLAFVTISTTQEFTSSTGLTNGQNSAQSQQQTNIGVNSPSNQNVDAITQGNANNNASEVIGVY